MARRSLLAPAIPPSSPKSAMKEAPAPEPSNRPSRTGKLHVGGYFDPRDPVVMAFQKLRVDLRLSQQEMLREAMADFVAKHEAAAAFGDR